MILMMYGFIIALMVTVFVVDYGMSFISYVELQHAADASAWAGAHEGKYGYYSVVDQEPRAVILPAEARTAAINTLDINETNMNDRTYVLDYRFNPHGEMGLSNLDQYYSGYFTVTIDAASTPILLERVSDIANIFHSVKSRTQVTPTLVN